MVNVVRTFEVQVNPSIAIAYLKDFSHAVEWDPGTVACERIGDASAPIEVGAKWHNTSKLIFINTELEYELQELHADRVLFRGTNKTATSYDDIRIEPSGAGAKVTYEATVKFNGVAALTDPVMKLIFLQLAKGTVRDLTAALEKL
ncbi:MAG: SRPBCC family protein [Actinomycetota bacterium]|nr:SRPBCC family protein [Actinomycetota bacterium]